MTQDKQEISSGEDGFFEKDGKRITIYKWIKYNDNSLIIYSDDKKGINRDINREKKNENPIFVVSMCCWTLTNGTKVVLRSPKDASSTDEETIILEDTKCVGSGEEPPKSERFKDMDNIFCFVFKDISSWKFMPYIQVPRKPK